MLRIQFAEIEKCTSNKKPVVCVTSTPALHVVLNGYGYVGKERIGRGQGFMCHREEFADYRPDPNAPWTYIWLRLSGEDSDGLFAECGLPLHSGVFSVSDPEEFARVAAALFDENGIYIPRNDRHCEAVTKLLFSLLAPRTPAEKPLSAPKRYVKEAQKFMRENYFFGIHVTDVAKHVSVDRKYLCTLFEQQTGMSTMDYLLKLRLDRAKELLVRGDLSVSIVAASVGYSDALGFSRIFKKHVGVSPREYKNGNRP